MHVSKFIESDTNIIFEWDHIYMSNIGMKLSEVDAMSKKVHIKCL